jgi:hypothetical protein
VGRSCGAAGTDQRGFEGSAHGHVYRFVRRPALRLRSGLRRLQQTPARRIAGDRCLRGRAGHDWATHRRRTGCVLSVLASKIQTWSHMTSAPTNWRRIDLSSSCGDGSTCLQVCPNVQIPAAQATNRDLLTCARPSSSPPTNRDMRRSAGNRAADRHEHGCRQMLPRHLASSLSSRRTYGASVSWRASPRPRPRASTRVAKPSIDAAKVEALKASGLGPTEIARRLKIGRASVYRVVVKRVAP